MVVSISSTKVLYKLFWAWAWVSMSQPSFERLRPSITASPPLAEKSKRETRGAANSLVTDSQR